MKRLVFLCLLALSATIVVGQQTLISKQLDNFHVIDLNGKLMVELIQSDSSYVDIKLQGTNSTRLQWGVKNEVLSVHLRPGGEKDAHGEVKIYYRSLSDLKVRGANVSIRDTLSQGIIDVDLDAGAIFGAALDVKDIRVMVAGNSAANLSGAVKYATLVASSKSKVNARPLSCQDVRIEATTGAEVYVKAVERLQITSNTGAAVYYQGEPEIFRSAVKMMGTVNNIGK